MDELIRRLTELVEQSGGDLAALTPEQLTELRTELRAGYAEVRPGVETDEQVEALARVFESITRVEAELAARDEAAAEEERQAEEARAAREARLAQMDGDLEAPEEPETPEEPAAPETPEEPETPETPAEPTPTQAASRPAPSGRAASLGSLGRVARPAPEAPTEPELTPGQTRLARRVRAESGMGVSVFAADEAGTEALGRTISERIQELKAVNPSATKHYLGRVDVERPHAVRQGDHQGNASGLIDEAVRRNTARKVAAAEQVASGQRRVAAGGICAPPQPDYTITVVGEAETPWIDGLATVQGIRPVSFYPWINISQVAAAGSRPGARPNGGIGTVTAAQDAAGYGGTNFAGVTTAIPNGGHAFKDCVRIDCPDPVTCTPEASFRCTTVGNFQAITFPEYVAAFDGIVNTYFNIYRDERSLAKVVAAGKKIQGLQNPIFGAARDLLDVIRRAATHVRNVRHAPNLPFNVTVPAFAAQMVAQDIAYSWSTGTDNLRVSATQALALLAIEEGIFVDTYNVSIGATGSGLPTVLPELVDGQALPDWMDEIRIIMYPEGGIWRQDYGELAFGLRETGMQTNDMSAFYEVFEQTCFRTSDILVIDVPLCVNGLQAGTVVKVCGTGEDGEDTSQLGPEVVGPQATNEIQSLAIDATGGTFPIGIDGETVTGIAYNASAGTVQTAVEGLSNVDPGDITVSKTGSTFFFQYHGKWAGENVPLLTSSGASLTGGASTATPATVQAGGL